MLQVVPGIPLDPGSDEPLFNTSLNGLPAISVSSTLEIFLTLTNNPLNTHDELLL